MFKQRRLGELEPVSKFERIFTLSIIVILILLSIKLCFKNSKSELKVGVDMPTQSLTFQVIDDSSIYMETTSAVTELKKDLDLQQTKVEIIKRRMEKIRNSADELLSQDPNDVEYTDIESIRENLQEVGGWVEKVKEDCSQIYKEYKSLKSNFDRTRNDRKGFSIQSLSNTHNNVRQTSSSPLDKVDSDIYDLCSYLYDIQEDNCFAEVSYIEISDKIDDYQERVDFENMKRSLKEKLSTVKISSRADISQVIGLTEEEIRYLLECSGLIEDPEIIETLPRVMVETVKEYPVNELWSIAVMASETGHFTSNLALNSFNYGGMMDAEGAMSFDSMEEGLYRAIRCLYLNMEDKPKKTIAEVNKSYCPDSIPGWTNLVMDVLSLYVTSDID